MSCELLMTNEKLIIYTIKVWPENYCCEAVCNMKIMCQLTLLAYFIFK